MDNNLINQNSKKYNVKHKKNGFHIIWKLDNKTISLVEEKLKIKDLKFIYCHMTIWNKSFYEKHKMDKLNKDYNEKLILFNIQRKIQKILLGKNNNYQIKDHIKKPSKQKRIILKDVFKINQFPKKIQYNFIFSYNLNDDKIYLVTLFRKK